MYGYSEMCMVARFIHRLKALGAPTNKQWGISQWFAKVVATTTGVKQGCRLLPTPFILYTDEL